MSDQQTAQMPDARMTEEMIESMRARAGTDLRIEHSVNNEEVTRIAVKKFAAGIGDVNPLWTDEEHATASAYGAPVAPPSFVIGCFSGIQFGWPGLGSFHSSTRMTMHEPIYWGDTISASCRYDGFDGPKPSSFAGRMVSDNFTNEYVNQRGETVASIRWSVINYERGEARRRAKGSSGDLVLPHPWTDEELERIEEQVRREAPRGDLPRCWEDVEVGDRVGPLTKGPVTLTDEVAFVAGGGAPIPRLAANAAALQAYADHPAWSFRDPETRAREPIYSVHYNRKAAEAMGVPYQYDVGFQRQCWQVQLLTHWAGDAGWVREVDAQYRGFVFLSDVIALEGIVTDKRVRSDGEAVVDIRTWAVNQRGKDVMPGTAEVALPRRDDDEARWPASRRAR